MDTNTLVGLLIAWVVTSISLFVIAQLSAFTGVEIDGFKKALISAAIFGILNALVRPVIAFVSAPITWLTFGMFSLVVNAIIFGLAAWIVTGFRLRWGIWSALIGSLALSVINSVIYNIIGS